MRNQLTSQSPLNVLYFFGHDTKSEFSDLTGFYQILFLFNQSGAISKDVMREAYQIQFQKSAVFPLFFYSLDDLKIFVTHVAQLLKSPEAFILSAQDWNVGIESTPDLVAYQDLFRRYGTALKLDEQTAKNPKGIKRFFS